MWGWPIRFGRGQISAKRLPSLAPHVNMYKMCTLEHTQEVNVESENTLFGCARTVGGRLGPTSNRSETTSRRDPRKSFGAEETFCCPE